LLTLTTFRLASAKEVAGIVTTPFTALALYRLREAVLQAVSREPAIPAAPQTLKKSLLSINDIFKMRSLTQYLRTDYSADMAASLKADSRSVPCSAPLYA
jgi:hypothetical protein